MKHTSHAIAAFALLSALPATAGTEIVTPENIGDSSSSATGFLLGKLSGETAMDRIWSAATLYKDESNPILQEFKLQGRHQIQFADGESETQDYLNSREHLGYGNHIEARRTRLGFKSKWFGKFKFEGQIDVWPELESDTGKSEFYRNLYDLYITYTHSDQLNISAGKNKVRFGREQEISSNQILTFERSLLANQLAPGEMTGLWVNGSKIAGNWLYEAGVYANDAQDEFSDFDQGAFLLAKVGYDYGNAAGLDSGVASIAYLHNTGNYGGGATYFDNSFVFSNDLSQGRFGLVTDVYAAHGNGAQSNVFGATLTPSYYVADGLQLVGSLHVAGADDNGLKMYSRYDGSAARIDTGSDRTSSYWSTYLGLNYYIYGHKLKLMNGVQYANAGDGDRYDGFTFLSGLRFSF